MTLSGMFPDRRNTTPQASVTVGGVGIAMSATQSTVSEVLAGIVKSRVRR